MKKENLNGLANKIIMPDDMDRRLKMNLITNLEEKKKKNVWNRFAVTAAIVLCIIVTFSGVAVAKSDLLRNWLTELGVNSKNAEKYIETDTAQSDSDWLTVKDVYLDGMKLVFVVQLQEGATVLPYDISDHSYIDGIDCLSDSFHCLGDGLYEGIIDLSVVNGSMQTTLSKETMIQTVLSKETIPVKVTLYCQGDNLVDRRDFEFSIPSKNMQLTTTTENETIPIVETDKNGTEVQIGTVTSSFMISPSTIQMKLHYEFTGEHAKENREKYADELLLYNVIDDAGNVMALDDVTNGRGYENHIEQDGFSSIDIMAELNKYDTNAKTITLYPVTIDYYTEGELEGKYILGTEVPHEERAITFKLQ